MIHNFSVPECDQKIIDLIQPDIVNGPWIAGGAVMKWVEGKSIETRDTQDVDVWFRNEDQLKDVATRLYGNSFIRKTSTGNAITCVHSPHNSESSWFSSNQDSLYPAIQLIKLNYFKSAQEIIDHFDFTCCQFVTDGRQIVYSDQSMIDLKARSLNVNPKRKDNTKIINRMLKYVTYGFEPSAKLLDYINYNKKRIDTNFSKVDCYDHVV